MRFISAAAIAMLTMICANPGAMAAPWQPVGNGATRIEIDRSRVGYGGDGLVSVWSRINIPQSGKDGDSRYNMVEALNRYTCGDNRGSSHFATIKRLYLWNNMLVRAESVLAPREVAIVPGSMEAAILAEVCTARPQILQAIASPGQGGLMDTDMRQQADVPLHFISVADASPAQTNAPAKPAASTSTATPSPGLRQFIAFPRIDPAQVQHPSDEPKPEEAVKPATPAKNVESAAVKSEAAKAGSSIEPELNGLKRHARELALATSGPRGQRRKTIAAPHGEQPPAAVIHWGYEDEGAPSRWGKLRTDYAQCEDGQRQSPIDIRDGIRVDLEPIKFDYRQSPFRIIDNGHTVQVNPGEGNNITVMGRTWRLVQLHFHRPAEERIDGRGFDMVMHLVHKDDEGRIAVVAVLIERGAEHPVIQTFWNNLPLETNAELAPAAAIDLNKLLPETRTYYTYMGSLTTPPCTEGVLWMVLKQPVQLSPEQIAIFSRLYRNNARPIQPSNGRLIKESR